MHISFVTIFYLLIHRYLGYWVDKNVLQLSLQHVDAFQVVFFLAGGGGGVCKNMCSLWLSFIEIVASIPHVSHLWITSGKLIFLNSSCWKIDKNLGKNKGKKAHLKSTLNIFFFPFSMLIFHSASCVWKKGPWDITIIAGN